MTGQQDDIAAIAKILTGDVAAISALPELSWARDVLDGKLEDPPEAVDSAVAEALVGTLTERGNHDVLGWLSTVEDREVAKAARRTLHQLRSRGVSVPDAAQIANLKRTVKAPSLAVEKNLPGLITLYDSAGYRAVWVATPGLRGVDLLTAQLSNRHGIVSYEFRALNRKRYRAVVKRLEEELGAAATSAQDALWLLYEAAAVTERLGRPLPSNLLPSLREIGPNPGGEHPALRLEPLREDMTGLYRLQEMRSWVPERDVLQRVLLKQQEIATSTIVANEEQRADQAREALAQAASEYFTPERCAICHRQLLDTAHVLASLRKELAARRVRAAADIFTLPPADVIAQPFVQQFFGQFFPDTTPLRTASARNEERSSGGLILP